MVSRIISTMRPSPLAQRELQLGPADFDAEKQAHEHFAIKRSDDACGRSRIVSPALEPENMGRDGLSDHWADKRSKARVVGEDVNVGLVWTVLAGAMLGLASYGLARDGFRLPRGWPRSLGAVVLAWSWATLGLQALGVLGLLDRLSLCVWAAVGLAVAVLFRFLRPIHEEPGSKRQGSLEFSAILAIAVGIWVTTMIGVPSLLLPPKVVSDGPIYHLYFAAKWWKAGRVFLIPTPFGETAAPYFPANGDLFFAGLMALYGGDRLARIGQVPFLFLTVATTFAMAKKLGASASSSAIAGRLGLDVHAIALVFHGSQRRHDLRGGLSPLRLFRPALFHGSGDW